MDGSEKEEALTLRDCALTALATGEEASTLGELRDRIVRAPSGSLYYHFWGRLLRPVLHEREYVNDFGNWVGYELRDPVVAERLALLDPADFTDMEELRARLVEILEERLVDGGGAPVGSSSRPFYFLKGKVVVFDTGRRVTDPAELSDVVPELPQSSIYYHFIDARARHEDGVDDFQRWLSTRGDEYRSLVTALSAVDLYYTPLEGLQRDLASLFAQFFSVWEGS